MPAQHPYTRSIVDPAHVILLPDPPPPGAPAGQWWPPQVLQASWIRANAAHFDLLHLHFGAESYSPAQVLDAFAEARRAGKPVVYTVHDLENPQLSEQSEHERMLDAIVPAADALITLTSSARAEIWQRWQREAAVIPHPTMIADAAASAPLGTPGRQRRIGVHLRDLRPNIDAVGTVTTMIAALSESGEGVVGSIRLNERVRDEPAAEKIADLASAADGVELVRGARLSDDALAETLADLDACVLPYSHGTHSGWLELSYDLAVPVIGPRAGHFGSQHPDEYCSFDRGDVKSFASAVRTAIGVPWSRPGSPERAAEAARRAQERATQRRDVREAHTALYRSLTTRRLAA